MLIIPNFNTIGSGAARGGGGAPPFEYTAIANNYSMTFDGSDTLINIPYNSFLNVVTGNHSLSFWMKANAGNVTVVIEKGSGDELAAWIVSNKIRWAGANTFDSATNINDNNWHHIVFVADGSVSYIYVDGSLDATGGNKIQASANTSDFVMGARANNSFNLLGQLDSVAIFNIALSPENIEKIYNTTNNNPGKVADLTETPEGAPIAWYRFE